MNFGRGSGQQYVLMPISHMNTPLPDSDLKTGGLSISQPKMYHVHYGGSGEGSNLSQSEPVTPKVSLHLGLVTTDLILAFVITRLEIWGIVVD